MENKLVSDIVRSDYRTADVFRRHGINYCCAEKLSVEEACLEFNIEYDIFLDELKESTRQVSIPNNLRYDKWKIEFLIDYIVNVHHAYINYTLPELEKQLQAFTQSHKKEFPELRKVDETFQELSDCLGKHNLHEEEIIFPYIKQIENTHRRREIYGSLFVRTLRKPLNNIEKEHSKITSLLDDLRELTVDYTIPENSCINHYVIYNQLKEFDKDLVHHKYLEHDILFPRAIEMERELLQL